MPYTDGAVEGRGTDGPFGLDRLQTVVSQWRGMSAEEVAARVERAVLDFVGDGGEDDMAILVPRLPGMSDPVGKETGTLSVARR